MKRRFPNEAGFTAKAFEDAAPWLIPVEDKEV
jgi:hypothetical protein